MHGPLYYRNLEGGKSNALTKAKGDFDAKLILSQASKNELKWRIQNVESTYQRLSHDEPSYQITKDASLSGWGAECQGIFRGGNGHHEKLRIT